MILASPGRLWWPALLINFLFLAPVKAGVDEPGAAPSEEPAGLTQSPSTVNAPERQAPRLATEGESWLRRMASALRERAYDLSFLYIHDGRVESMRVLHAKGEDGIERERLIYLNGPLREVLREGEQLSAILPDEQLAALQESDGRRAGLSGIRLADVDSLARYYSVELKGEQRIAGRQAVHLLLSSRDGYRYGYRLWLDKDSGLLLRSDRVDEQGRVIEQILVVAFDAPPQLTPESLRAESPLMLQRLPAYTETASPEAVSSRWQVGWLPEGFTASPRRGRSSVDRRIDSLMFDDGLATVSVYIQPRQGEPRRPDVLRRGGTTVYDRAREQFLVTVIGEVPLVTAQKIAESVQKRPGS